MDQKVLHRLEYDKITELLAREAASSRGKQLCQTLTPLLEPQDIDLAQEQTAAALTRIFQKGSPAFGNTVPVETFLKRLEVGASLNSEELLCIAGLLMDTSQCKAYGRQDSANMATDCLEAFFAQLEPLTPLAQEIERCITGENEFHDDASPALKQIRRKITGVNDKIHATLQTLLNGSLRNHLQDALITMRNNRYCIPVKAEYKAQVRGMIHDQSASGATLFIEPMAIVQLNNQVKDLQAEEKVEIQRILTHLSLQAAEHIEEIRTNYQVLTTLDFIFAKGRLALAMNAIRPLFNTDGNIYIREGRHPLLDPKKVVPITFQLNETASLLIITGPNTGGKTVTLKTVGLLTLMGQAGLHIPAADRSQLAIFHDMYADIGDEQSIEQNLSTFSAHMTNIVSFLQKANRQSLVLFDELGAGTDPTEGAALAISILSYLHRKQICTIATTHYSELKVFASSTEGVENACCEFDVNTLKPTYRLLMGVPGKSNAFAISRKLGLPEEIIESAKEQMSQQHLAFEDLLTDLETDRRQVDKEKSALQRSKQEVQRLEKDLILKEERLRTQREHILQEAREQAAALLRDAKATADATMKTLRKADRAGDANTVEQTRERLRKKIKETAAPTLIPAKAKKQHKPSDFKPGEAVKVLSMHLDGIVTTAPDARGYVTVQMGILRSQVPISDLEIKEEPDSTHAPAFPKQRTGGGLQKSLSVRPEINVIGKTVDEAVAVIEKYLDDALLSHLNTVRIVHGKGTGALRKGIHRYLQKQPFIKDFHLAEFGEGDAGVTVVDLGTK